MRFSGVVRTGAWLCLAAVGHWGLLSAQARQTAAPATTGQTQPKDESKAGKDDTKSPKNEDIEKAGEALQKGQVDEALKLLQEAVKKKPDLPPARLMLARILLSNRNLLPQGKAMVEQASAENPDHPEIYLTLASLALSEGRLSDSILDCQKALAAANAGKWTEEQKKNFLKEARAGLTAAFEARREWASARTQLQAWLETDPQNGAVRQRLAQALFFLDKPDDAFSELQIAVKDDKTLTPPSVTMAAMWTTKGDTKKAREWLEKAIKAEPNSTVAHLAYANWLIQQNELDAAKIEVDAAAKVKPDDVEVLRAQGLVARVMKDLGSAEKTFRKILNDSPGDNFASNQLALVLADQSDKDQRARAVQLAEVNARQYPNSADVLATLGYVYYRVGAIDEALRVLQAAVSSGQALPDTAFYLALCLVEREKLEDARNLLKGALASNGLFVYRKEAKTLFDRLEKQAPPKEAPKDAPKEAPKNP